MSLLIIKCPTCGKSFPWNAKHQDQRCAECRAAQVRPQPKTPGECPGCTKLTFELEQAELQIADLKRRLG